MANPTIITYASGISAMMVVCVGFLITIVSLIKYTKERKPMLPILAIIGICFGMFYLDITLSFITIMITGENQIPVLVSGWIAFGTGPIAMFCIMWITFEIFKPELKKKVLIIIGLSGIIYWILLFGFPDLMIGGFVD